jgi:hypothetical protein
MTVLLINHSLFCLLRGFSSGMGYRSHAFRETEDMIMGEFFLRPFWGSEALTPLFWVDESE